MGGEHAAIEVIETAWIPLSDGRRLAARLFLPADARANPVPCILEYLPYRRRDGTRLRDDAKHKWFAANGYCAARVDIAGTGDSDGLVEDEYVAREQDDGVEVIAWLAAQPWCSGSVGVEGISWGGFNGLQLAARRPPALKAIVTVCSSDDRYRTDAHFSGGCLLNDHLGWGGSFQNIGAQPPDPAVVGADRWRKMWRDRIDAVPMFAARWLEHQRRDEFWLQGSVCTDYGGITAAVLAVGGWLDGYVDTIFRLQENLTAPCKAVIGPWGHKEPNAGVPGPGIDFLGLCKRWWDRWLKGIDNGAETDPAVRAYVMDPAPPEPLFTHRAGRWVSLPDWPNRRIAMRRWHFGAGALADAAQPGVPVSLRSPQTTGAKAQEWCPYGQGRIAAEGATDQREDDAGSLCFDTAVLEQPLHILGAPAVRLRLSADRPAAVVAVRLCDVAPDGTSAMVTWGVLNLSHRDSDADPQPLIPGQAYDISVPLKHVGQTLAPGHRLRLAVSTSYWPMIWPAPEPVLLTLDPAGSVLDLPLLAGFGGLLQPVFAPPVEAEMGPVTTHREGGETRDIHSSIDAQTQTFDIISDDGDYTIDEIGTRITGTRVKTYHIQRDDPLSARTAVTSTISYSRDDWKARLETSVTLRASATHFHLTGTLTAHEGDTVFATRNFDQSIPRDYM
ncbi:MAG: CocE/NonD family hydrolase [Paracoccaceae bacterium]